MMLVFWLACSGGGAAVTEAPLEPQPFGEASCEVCGMVVREQPAPRGQAVHRDGTVAQLCSVGDLRAHLQTPNPHGEVQAAWVEGVPADFDPLAPAGPQLPWVRVEQASWVVGLERPQVMGRPALTTASPAEAQSLAERLGARMVGWAEVQATPFPQDPP